MLAMVFSLGVFADQRQLAGWSRLTAAALLASIPAPYFSVSNQLSSV
jgi:hypothetical protein